MLSGPTFIVMHVNSVSAAIPFYTNILGMEVQEQGTDWVRFKTGDGVRLALSQDHAPNPDSTNEVGWDVADINSLYDDYVAKGVEVVQPITEIPFGRTFIIKDPDGNKLYFLQLPH